MTNREALYELKRKLPDKESNPLFAEAYDMAINALDKQIPKRPLEEVYFVNHEFYDTVEKEEKRRNVCICGNKELLRRRDSYCFRCGQAIDWSDSE